MKALFTHVSKNGGGNMQALPKSPSIVKFAYLDVNIANRYKEDN